MKLSFFRSQAPYNAAMYYGQSASILPTGEIRIPRERLLTLGIGNRSACWATMLPSSSPDSSEHFILSPIHPTLWPFTFRIECKISDKIGAARKLTGAIKKLGGTILPSECAPSGHNHATWNGIVSFHGQPDRKELAALSAALKDLEKHFDEKAINYNNPEFLKLTNVLAECACDFERYIETELISLNRDADNGNFLHHRFLRGNDTSIVQLDDWEDEELRYRYKHLAPTGVRCKRLHYLAFHWSFIRRDSKKNPETFLLHYNSSSQLFSPSRSRGMQWRQKLKKEIPGSFPCRLIATLHYGESYVRLLTTNFISNAGSSVGDRSPQTFEFQFPYQISRKSTRHASPSPGVMEKFLETLEKNGISLGKASNATELISEIDEIGSINVVGVEDREVMGDTKSSIQKYRELRLSKIRSSIREISDKPLPSGDDFNIGSPIIRRYGPMKLFISTRATWATNDLTRFNILCDAARELGFEVFHYLGAAGEDEMFERLGLAVEGGSYTGLRAREVITKCDAFLQINPAEIINDDSVIGGDASGHSDTLRKRAGLRAPWMLFELGIADGLNMPRVVLADKWGGSYDFDLWHKILPPLTGEELVLFDTFGGNYPTIERLEELHRKLEVLVRKSCLTLLKAIAQRSV